MKMPPLAGLHARVAVTSYRDAAPLALGHSSLRMGELLRTPNATAVPSGGSPDGTGQWPVPPRIGSSDISQGNGRRSMNPDALPP